MKSKYTLAFSSPAVRDLDEIVAWYNLQKVGLGEEFLFEIEQSLNKIAASPTAFRIVKAISVRKFSMKRFPYMLFYHLHISHIEILAIIHSSRSPAYIKRRLKF